MSTSYKRKWAYRQRQKKKLELAHRQTTFIRWLHTQKNLAIAQRVAAFCFTEVPLVSLQMAGSGVEIAKDYFETGRDVLKRVEQELGAKFHYKMFVTLDLSKKLCLNARTFPRTIYIVKGTRYYHFHFDYKKLATNFNRGYYHPKYDPYDRW